MRNSRTLFDLADLNPLGNPLSSFDETIDESTGLPRSIMESLLDDRKKKKRYPWDENPMPVTMPEMGGRTIPLTPPPPDPTLPEVNPADSNPTPPVAKKDGWRNKISLRGIAGALGDGLVGASTPNIAYGGGQDIIRAGAAGWGSHQTRAEKMRQRELEEERRKVEAERRKVESEERTRRIKLEEAKAERDKVFAEHQLETDKIQREAAKKTAAAAEKASQNASVRVLADGTIVDLDTKTVTRVPPEDPIMIRRKQFQTQFDLTKDPYWDPNSKDNQKRIAYGDKPDPFAPKQDMNRTLDEALMSDDPKIRGRAEEIENGRRRAAKDLAYIRKATDDGMLSPNEAAKLEATRQRITQSKEVALGRALNAFTAQSAAASRMPTAKERTAAQSRAEQVWTDEKTRVENEFAAEEKEYRTGLSKIGSPAKGGGTPAAGGGVVGKIFTGPDGKKYRATGVDAQGNVVGDLVR